MQVGSDFCKTYRPISLEVKFHQPWKLDLIQSTARPKEQLQPGAAVGLGLVNEEFDCLAHEASRLSVEYNCDADG